MSKTCKWISREEFYGEYSDHWSTDCGQVFVLNDGTPGDNNMKYCCFCGKKIKQLLKQERTCRVCGCTDDQACEGGCHWVEDDLCSSCAPKEDQ